MGDPGAGFKFAWLEQTLSRWATPSRFRPVGALDEISPTPGQGRLVDEWNERGGTKQVPETQMCQTWRRSTSKEPEEVWCGVVWCG